ncbi:MAG: hypothetical protein Q9166_007440 [cf. Caloplaca sp. 2 TL-2023]
MATISAKNAHPAILSFCFASGLNERKFRCNDPIIYAACDASSIAIFAVLLDQGGMAVNHWLELGGDVLIAAIYAGNLPLVKYLLAQGADPNSDYHFGEYTALSWAVIGPHNRGSTGEQILRVLFEYGTKIVEIGALIAAAEKGNLAAVKVILEMKGDEVDPEEVVDPGPYDDRHADDLGTAFYKAAAGGHSEIVDILIRSGADIGFKDRAGRSVIDIARGNEHEIAIRLGQLMNLPPST